MSHLVTWPEMEGILLCFWVSKFWKDFFGRDVRKENILVEKNYIAVIFFNGTRLLFFSVQPKKYNRLYLRVEKELDAHIW